MGIGVNFDGKYIVHPGVYSKIDASGMMSYRGVKNGIPALIGTAKGGKPNTVYTFSSPKEAYAVLRGGNLLNVINAGWQGIADPTVGDISPFRVVAIRVADGAAQGSYTLQDATPANTITVTSKDYGVWTNSIKVIIEDGTISGKKIEIWDTERNVAEIKDNLGDILTIQYTGSEDNARMNITTTNGVATELKIETSPDATTWTTLYDLDLTKTENNTILKIFAILAGKSDLTVTLSPYLYDKNVASSVLPTVTDQDIKSAAYLVSNPASIMMDYVNRFSDLISMDWATGSSYETPANAEIFLTGGTDGSAPSSWKTAIDLLENEDVSSIAVLTDSQAIHNELATHITAMAGADKKMPRFGVVGGATGETVEEAINRANSFNNPYMHVFYPGIYKTLSDTGYSLQAPWFAAGMYAIAIAMSMVRFPLTNKAMSVEGVEVKLDPAVIDRLIENGVTTLEFVPNRGYIIPFAVTTYIANDNELLRKTFTNGIGIYIKRRVDARLFPYIGSVSYAHKAEILRQAVESELSKLLKENIITPSDGQPAWRNLEVIIQNNTAYVSYETSPVDELDYILVTHKYNLFTATA